jgi:putative thioredoxin
MKENLMAGTMEQPQTADGAAAGSLVKDIETASFGPDVITESHQQPVLVVFWAPGTPASKQHATLLERVVKSARGKVKLAKMNIEEHPQIPERLGIRNVPAVVAFQKSQPADGFMGALPENQIRGFIERLVGPIDAGTDLLAEAEGLLAGGDPTGAAEIFATILGEDPSEFKALAGLIKAFVAAGEIASARKIVGSIPPAGERDPAIIAAKAIVDLAEQAASVGDLASLKKKIEADPKDYQSRFDLAIAYNAKGERDAAADQLLEIIRLDRTWNDDGARKQLLQFFEAWNLMDPATLTARRKLSSLLFS